MRRNALMIALITAAIAVLLGYVVFSRPQGTWDDAAGIAKLALMAASAVASIAAFTRTIVMSVGRHRAARTYQHDLRAEDVLLIGPMRLSGPATLWVRCKDAVLDIDAYDDRDTGTWHAADTIDPNSGGGRSTSVTISIPQGEFELLVRITATDFDAPVQRTFRLARRPSGNIRPIRLDVELWTHDPKLALPDLTIRTDASMPDRDDRAQASVEQASEAGG